MKLDTLYIVTYPTETSSLPLILHELWVDRLKSVGLWNNEIAAIYTDREEAKEAALQLLAERDEEQRQVDLIRIHLRRMSDK